VSDLDEKHLESLDRRIKAVLGPHWFLQETGDEDLWAFYTHAGDMPTPIHELDEIEGLQLEQGTDRRGLCRPEGRG
jgi:hypothetical protein